MFGFAGRREICLAVFLMMSPLSFCLADIATDGSVGPKMALSGPDFRIGPEFGTTRGSNLFHSFRIFNVGTGESATFTGPASIANVISRVTGGRMSTIDGFLRSEVGNADFFFINPAGVVFGPNARVDVPAAFHVSTADELRFADGSVYSATDPDRSTLSMAAPESFGFLSPQPASIEVNGSTLEFAPGQTVSISAGDVAIAGGDTTASVRAPGGEIRISAVGDQAAGVPFAGTAEQPGNGSLHIEYAQIDTSGDGGGTLIVRAGQATLTDATLAADNLGDTDATGGIDLAIAGPLDVLSSSLHSTTFAAGSAGSIRIRADSLQIRRSSILSQATSEGNLGVTGDSGNIEVTVDSLLELFDGGRIDNATWTTGNAGDIVVKAGELRIDGDGTHQFTGIQSRTVFLSKGDGGSVQVMANGLLELRNGAEIANLTEGLGDEGGVVVKAEDLCIDGKAVGRFTGIRTVSDFSLGNAGTIEVIVDRLLELRGGAEISSSATFSFGDAGSVVVQAGELRMDGEGTDQFQFNGIRSETDPFSTGDAGVVTVRVNGQLEMLGATEISSTTMTSGKAGGVVVQAGELRIDGDETTRQFTGIHSQAGSGSAGDAGDVTVTVDGLLELFDGAVISSSTFSVGNAGKVSVEAGTLRIDGEGTSDQFTGIASQADLDSGGDAGGVEITVDGLLELLEGAAISSSTFAAGDAGSVVIRADTLRIDAQGNPSLFTGINSQADPDSSGSAGSIEVTVDGQLELLDGALISTSTFAVGEAGSIVVQAGALRIDEGTSGRYTAIVSTAEHGSSGEAGDVTVTVNGLLELFDGAAISSSTFAVRNAGSVTVQAGELRIDGEGAPGQFATGIISTAEPDSSGDAGSIEVTVDGMLELLNSGAQISTSTHAVGSAGSIVIQAGRLRIDDRATDGTAGIASNARMDSSGDAGSIEVTVDGLLELRDGATISSSTFAVGDAGSVAVQAGALHIDGRRTADRFTGIATNAESGSSGKAGDVTVTVDGLLELRDGAQISSRTAGLGDAGSVTGRAETLRMSGVGAPGRFTGVLSDADAGSGGEAGSVEVTVDGLLELRDGAAIGSSTFSVGDAGSVSVSAGALRVDGQGAPDRFTGIATNANSASEGDAGRIEVNVDGLLELLDGADVSSSTFAVGDAGSVSVHAGALRIDGKEAADWFTGISTNAESGSSGKAGDVVVTVDGLLELRDGAQISSRTAGLGDAGSVTGRAETLRMSGVGAPGRFTGVLSDADAGSGGEAGSIEVTVDGLLELRDGAAISSSTFSVGDAGSVSVFAGALRVDGQGTPDEFTGIATDANSASEGDAGRIEINVDGLLELSDAAEISSSTAAAGDAGSVSVHAGALRIDGKEAADWFTGISTNAESGSSGKAGDVVVTVDGLLELRDGAQISSRTAGLGDAGSVTGRAETLRMSGVGAPGRFTGVLSDADAGSGGEAGSIEVTVDGLLELRDGATISSSTFAAGDAGSVAVQAGAVQMDGRGAPGELTGIATNADSGSSGDAGEVRVTADGSIELLGGALISSRTLGAGDGGIVVVRASELHIDGKGQSSGVVSTAGTGSGDAGTVTVEVAGRAELLDGARISTESDGGAAGTVSLRAEDLLIDGRGRSTGLSSRALTNATGDVGNIDVEVGGLKVLGGGEITIDADQTLASGGVEGDRASHIRIAADNLYMDGGRISARSTGDVPASSIDISAGEMLIEGVSRITTESNQADAGPIRIDVGDLLWLRNSEITTSVLGEAGDGGDITLRSDFMILEGGFVQANTAAQGARGGDILIDARALVASQGVVEIGGAQRQVFEPGSGRNVIQAAAPGGEQGLINIIAPEFDITASLVPLATPFDDSDDLINNACLTAAGEQESSLVQRGAGGVPATSREPAVMSFAGERLDRVLGRPTPRSEPVDQSAVGR